MKHCSPVIFFQYSHYIIESRDVLALTSVSEILLQRVNSEISMEYKDDIGL